ncbi:hypothetical protein CRUP_028384, partial [Coryphaenoides rupestris]
NLDALHDHLGTIYPGMRAPSFRCTDAERGNNLILHYYSQREGLQDILQPGTCNLPSVFSLVRPHIDFNFHGILSHINTVFVLRSKEGLLNVEPVENEDELTGVEISCLRLKGQMIYLPEAENVLFLCSPSVMNLDDLTRRGLYLSDIPLHDATRDLVLLGEQFREEYKLTQELEILTDRLQHTLRALEDEKKKTDR